MACRAVLSRAVAWRDLPCRAVCCALACRAVLLGHGLVCLTVLCHGVDLAEPSRAVLCCAELRRAGPCHAVLHHAATFTVLCRAVGSRWCAWPCHAMSCRAVPCRAVHHAAPCHAVCCALPCLAWFAPCAVVCYAIVCHAIVCCAASCRAVPGIRRTGAQQAETRALHMSCQPDRAFARRSTWYSTLACCRT